MLELSFREKAIAVDGQARAATGTGRKTWEAYSIAERKAACAHTLRAIRAREMAGRQPREADTEKVRAIAEYLAFWA